MAPVIHLVRHAQGYHNLSEENQWLPDPDLTDLGKQQCADLNAAFPYHDKITDLVASPLRRTIFTCQFSFPDEVAAGKKITALPDCQEVSLYPSDTGTDAELLRAEFNNGVADDDDKAAVDFRLVEPGWNYKQEADSPYYPDPPRLEARARRARVWLRDLVRGRDDAHVVVVTHGAILHFLTEDWSDIKPERGTGWQNTEYRSYSFTNGTQNDDDPAASLTELPESRKRRVGSEIPLTAKERLGYRVAYDEVNARETQRCIEKMAQRKKDEEAKKKQLAAENGTNGTNGANGTNGSV